MTVIAWDGKTLAADRLALNGYVRGATTKIFRLQNYERLVGVSGDFDCCMALLKWLEGERQEKDWPTAAQSSNGWAKAIEIDRHKLAVRYYERHPHALTVTMPYHAIGAGRECAIGVMAMGGSAVLAVEIAIQHIDGCGAGIDELRFE